MSTRAGADDHRWLRRSTPEKAVGYFIDSWYGGVCIFHGATIDAQVTALHAATDS
jgi:hypothetical protein